MSQKSLPAIIMHGWPLAIEIDHETGKKNTKKSFENDKNVGCSQKCPSNRYHLKTSKKQKNNLNRWDSEGVIFFFEKRLATIHGFPPKKTVS